MSGYLESDFLPDREFWSAFNITNECPICGYKANGTTLKSALLDGPNDCECRKCGSKWSIAIPIGDCPERTAIQELLVAEGRFYRLRDELRNTINMLHDRVHIR